jgi:hypothetical protein
MNSHSCIYTMNFSFSNSTNITTSFIISHCRRVCDQTGAHVARSQKYAIASRQTLIPTRRQAWSGSIRRRCKANIYRSHHRDALYARGNETPAVNHRSHTHFVHKYIVTETSPLDTQVHVCTTLHEARCFETNCHLRMLFFIVDAGAVRTRDGDTVGSIMAKVPLEV